MSITVEMSDYEIAAMKRLTHLNDDAEALVRAAREFLRLSAVRELKAASGHVDFELDWQNLESLELAESTLPK